MHIPKENINKLDEKSIKCVFIGYSDEPKFYTCYDLIFEKLYINRYVIFNEGGSYMEEDGRIDITPNFEESNSNE